MRSTQKSSGKEKVSANKKGKLNHEWRRIDYFFEIFSEDGGAEELWKMLKLALTCDNESNDAKNRSNMLFFYEYTKELFENIFTLLQKQKDKKGLTEHAVLR